MLDGMQPESLALSECDVPRQRSEVSQVVLRIRAFLPWVRYDRVAKIVDQIRTEGELWFSTSYASDALVGTKLGARGALALDP